MRDLPPELMDRTAVLLRAALTRAETMGEEVLVPLGISGREYGVLALVMHGEAPPTQRHLGDVLGMDRTTTMKVVTGLVDRGLVERQVDARDRRAYRAQLTAAGRRLTARAQQVLADCDDRFVAGRLDADEVAELRAMLARLV